MTFKLYLEKISEATVFLESFDAPHEKKEIFPKMDHEALKSAGVTDYHEYELGGDPKTHGNLTSYKRKGAYEIHHDVRNVSGEMLHSDKPNPRFVATMVHHAKGLIDQGHSVRIVGHKENGMFDHYHRIAKALARKNGYNVSTPTNYSHTSSSMDAHKFHEFIVNKNESNLTECIIFPSGKGGPLEDIWKIRTFSD
jgi:hypothetical protein